MNNNLQQMLKEVNCIDNFVKEVNDPIITNIWYSICEDYRFQVNNLPVNEETLDDWLFNSYRKFIYIGFYITFFYHI